MSKIISFPQGGTAYIQTTLEGLTLEEKRARGNVTALDCLTGPQLVDLHNLIAANIGQGRVKRFADAKTAVRRTWAMLEAYEAEVKAEASTLDEFHAKHQAMHAPKVTTSVSNPPNIPNTDRVKASISNPSNKPPRWARPKHETVLGWVRSPAPCRLRLSRSGWSTAQRGKRSRDLPRRWLTPEWPDSRDRR